MKRCFDALGYYGEHASTKVVLQLPSNESFSTCVNLLLRYELDVLRPLANFFITARNAERLELMGETDHTFTVLSGRIPNGQTQRDASSVLISTGYNAGHNSSNMTTFALRIRRASAFLTPTKMNKKRNRLLPNFVHFSDAKRDWQKFSFCYNSETPSPGSCCFASVFENASTARKTLVPCILSQLQKQPV